MPEINGTGAADSLDGAGGDDVIKGLGGSDALSGGAGNDVLYGGGGATDGGSITRISVASTGAQATGASGASFISPDGQTVVFWSRAENLDGENDYSDGLFRLDIATGEVSRISANHEPGVISFSPHGSSIAYLYGGSARIINLETGRVRVEDDYGIDAGPVFSADGRSIFILSGQLIESAILSGGSSSRLSVNADRFVAIDFAMSPDREKVAVLLERDDESGLDEDWIIRLHDRQTGAVLEVASGRYQGGDAQSLVFSDDGEALAWAAGRTLAVYDIASGTTRTLLTETAGQQFGVVGFTADDQALIITATTGGVSEIWGVDVATGAVTILAQGTDPSVSPDGSFITFTSEDALVAGDTNNLADVYRLDLTWSPGGSAPDGDDVLNGGGGNDVLDGGLGADVMTGGVGDDTFHVDDDGDVVQEAVNEGQDTVFSSISFSLGGTNAEVLQLTGEGAINATGSAGADTLIGNGAANVLNGVGGPDILRGGRGDDTYIIDSLGMDQVVELSGEGRDTVVIGSTFSLETLPDVENVTLTGTGAFDVTGNDAANVLRGNAGNNVLDGKLGRDTMIGGGGDDTYWVDQETDSLGEDAGGGYDTARSTVDYTLSIHVERLILVGNAVVGTGNSGANLLVGNEQNNRLNGMAGDDTMVGRLGNDTFFVDSAGDQVIELAGEGRDTVYASVSFALGADVHVETLMLLGAAGAGWATGNGIANTIYGNSFANTLDGGGGDDVLNGGGDDTMIGGAGNDTFYVKAGDVVVEARGGGADTIISSFSYVLQAGVYVEALNLTGTQQHINGTGNGIANTITGNAGNNVLDGGKGADTLVGGKGDDTYVIDNPGDVIVEVRGDGTDAVYASATFTLRPGVYVEDLFLTGAADINGTGNGIANVIRGNAGNNNIDGGAGNDSLYGGAGSDTLNGGVSGIDQMYGGTGDDVFCVNSGRDKAFELKGEGTDHVHSSVSYTLNNQYIEYLTLTGSADIYAKGNSLDNRLVGNSGDNRINGMGGQDRLTGGAGADTFIWDATSHSKVNDSDRIVDLSNADFIDLSRIDANTTVGGTQHFVLVDAFTNTAGQVVLTFDAGSNVTSLNADTNGDGVSDMLVRIDGDHTDFANFIFGGG